MFFSVLMLCVSFDLISWRSAAMSAFRSDLFSGKVALITGGGTGIGYAIAKGVQCCKRDEKESVCACVCVCVCVVFVAVSFLFLIALCLETYVALVCMCMRVCVCSYLCVCVCLCSCVCRCV